MEKEIKEAEVEEVVEETEEVEEEPKTRSQRRAEKEEMDEEFVDKKDKSMISKIVNVALWVILIAWMGVCIFDFVNVKGGKAPTFCISKKTTTYSDGTVETCVGAGYKVYNYKREAIKAVEFGPLWGKERLSDLK